MQVEADVVQAGESENNGSRWKGDANEAVLSRRFHFAVYISATDLWLIIPPNSQCDVEIGTLKILCIRSNKEEARIIRCTASKNAKHLLSSSSLFFDSYSLHYFQFRTSKNSWLLKRHSG